MSRDQRFNELDHHPPRRAPAEREPAIGRAAIGVAAGLVIGVMLDLLFYRLGARSNPLSVLAVPIAAAVIGLTMAMLLSATERNRLDAPVRGRASTTERLRPAHRR